MKRVVKNKINDKNILYILFIFLYTLIKDVLYTIIFQFYIA